MDEREGVMEALLRSKEPSIRWKTRTKVLGEDRDSKAIRSLEEEIRTSPRVRALLSRREQLGRPETARQVYNKWQGVHWVLAALADIGYPRQDASLGPIRDRVLEFWLKPAYFREFEAKSEADAYKGHHDGVPVMAGRARRCASQQGNALYSVTTLGLADERADALAERLLHWQWPDGGWNCDKKPKADTSSFMESLTPMIGLAAHARDHASPAVSRAIERASEVFLRRKLFRRVSNGRVIRPDFVNLHYPLYWHYDILAGLKAMAYVGKIRDRRCAEALDLLESKQLPDGGWPAEARYYAVRPATFEANSDYVDWGGTSKQRTNEWVTIDALHVLRAAGRT